MRSASSDQHTPLNRVYAWFSALAKHDHEGMDDLLAHGVPVDVPHPLRHTTALMEATRLGRTTTIHWLLARGAAPAFLCGMPPGTPLHCAIRLHHWVIAAFLTHHCEHVAVTDSKGCTPLHVLAEESNNCKTQEPLLQLAGTLLGKDCPLDALNREGLTALHYAVINEQPLLVELLLRHGANPNSRVPDSGMTPLAMSAINKNLNIARLLMHFGANPHQQIGDGSTPATILPTLSRLVAGAVSRVPR